MKRSFSFSEKPVLFLLQKFPSLLPGIDKVITIYFDQEIERLNSYSMIKVNEEYILEESEVNDSNESLIKYRKVTTPYSWIQIDEIPYEIIPKSDVQLTIFSELNNNVLLLRITNENDGLNDLFFFYFNNNPSNFGMVDSKKVITTENKTIIGHLMKNSIETILSTFYKDRELFITLSENNHTVIHELINTKKDLAVTREKMKDVIIHLCNSYLEDLSRDYGYRFVFSRDAIDKLKDYKEDLGPLKEILIKAVEFALSAQINNNWNEIIIHDYQLLYNTMSGIKTPGIVPVMEPNSDIPIRYNKTFMFLNKLETAAEAVKSKNLLLTSMNVGQELPSPVTPAAISDALKNHQSKINYLFQLLPDRWHIIRSEFRPVQNILNPKAERQKRTA